MLTLFYDYTTAASAVAVARLQRLADQGLPVAFEGFEAVGVETVLPLTLDVVAALDSLAAEAAAEAVTLRRPPNLPPTGLAHAVGTVAERSGLGPSWRAACFGAFWEEGVNLGDPDCLRELAQQAGLDATEVTTALTDRSALLSVRRRCASRRREGVGGVPTILSQRTLIPGLLPEPDLRALARL